MINFLIKKFVTEPQESEGLTARKDYGVFSSAVGLVVNITLSLGKVVVGTIFNSIAVTADGINNLSDAGSSLVTLIGFKMSGKPADREHPFGHARIEYVTGLFLGIVIIFVGLELIRSSISKIIYPRPTNYSTLLFVVLTFSVVIKLWQSRFYAKIAEIINSSTIKAASVDSMNDVLATSVILAGALFAKLFKFEIDGWMGIGVALFILYSAVGIIKSILGPILGEMPDPEFIKKIEQKILSYEGILNIHDLVVHNYGPDVYFATVHAEVDANENFIKSHDIIDRIERDSARDLNINLVIHMDPVVIDDDEVSVIRKRTEEIVKQIKPVLNIHDFRIVKGITHTDLIFDVIAPEDLDISATKLIEKIEMAIKEEDSNYYPVITINKNYFSTANY